MGEEKVSGENTSTVYTHHSLLLYLQTCLLLKCICSANINTQGTSVVMRRHVQSSPLVSWHARFPLRSNKMAFLLLVSALILHMCLFASWCHIFFEFVYCLLWFHHFKWAPVVELKCCLVFLCGKGVSWTSGENAGIRWVSFKHKR